MFFHHVSGSLLAVQTAGVNNLSCVADEGSRAFLKLVKPIIEIGMFETPASEVANLSFHLNRTRTIWREFTVFAGDDVILLATANSK